MMNLREYRLRPNHLSDYLPWAGLVAPGVVLNKDGSFQRTAQFRGPDLDSATEPELAATAARLNNALKRLGSGWAVFVEAQRSPANEYPHSHFPDALSRLIDEERRVMFEDTSAYFESRYFLTLLYLPEPEAKARATQVLFESTQRHAVDWREHLKAFINQTDRFTALLDSVMPEIRWLSDTECLTYLHSTVSHAPHPVHVPEVPFHLDALLSDRPMSGGIAPRLGDQHVRALTVRGFPHSTWPGMLDELNRLGFAYRWMTRFILLDKKDAEQELTKVRRQWFSKRKGIVTLLRESLFKQESALVNNDATNKASDADAALQELGNDEVAYGYLTSTVVVLDSEADKAEEKRRMAERVIQNRGFVCIAESINAVDAFLGSLPGHAYANIRQPPVNTQNLAHLMPLSAVWAGPTRNEHLNGPVLTMTRTAGETPFRLNLHVGDVGHTLIVGPTGSGKSVLLATLVMQFRRYPDSRIYVFDKKRSIRATILGLGGEHYDLGGDTDVAFQPLARIDEEHERTWAADWVCELLSHEGIDLTPDVKDSVWTALQSLATAPAHERTLTGLSVLIQANRLRQALLPYTLGGPHGRLLDAERDRLKHNDIQAFETEQLMSTRSAVLPVLTYLFHRLEDRFDGRPTLLVLDEAWIFLDSPLFAQRLREWLKTLRSKNVSVVFSTQSLADIKDSSIAPALIESCPTRIFLASPQAREPQLRPFYEGFGLNERQIQIVTDAQPKRDYYYQSPLGNRLFDLGLGPIALAFAAAGRLEDQREISGLTAGDRAISGDPRSSFAARWLTHRGLDWAAQLLQQISTEEELHP